MGDEKNPGGHWRGCRAHLTGAEVAPRANSSCMYGMLPLDCQIQRRIWQSAVSSHPVH